MTADADDADMTDRADMTDPADVTDALPAGDYGAWLVSLQRAIQGEHDSDVPCAECTACCTSSQFIHIGPDEKDTLAHIPRALLFPAPGLPRGHVVMGYDDRGHCPMLVDDRCTIYAHRPRTCRTYDCRIFPATGVAVDGGRIRIEAQARRWRFRYPNDADAAQRDAVRAAAEFLEEHREAMPPGAVPRNATQLAVLAVELHDLFLPLTRPADHGAVVERLAGRAPGRP